MKNRVPIWLPLIALAVALNVVATKPASAGRDLSPYCMGTSPRNEVVIEINEGSVTPSTISVTEGECVELVVHAKGGEMHSLMIDKTDITSEGAPLIDGDGRHTRRAVARQNAVCPTCRPLAEGWFAKGETVFLKFQVNTPGSYELKCEKGMRVTIEASPEPVMFSS